VKSSEGSLEGTKLSLGKCLCAFDSKNETNDFLIEEVVSFVVLEERTDCLKATRSEIAKVLENV
jgi:hypothetical protein